ncbi:hypothetical protein [Actinomyces wuliandei]|uniref:hypothetical protein n=1 Tax=Actinomyces wuliandei TaxID=2057743 RepID=UPI001119AA4D|nr:hypothetical protein [Actinomyces wuliandei]
MSTTSTHVTLVHEGERLDVAVRTGTTVAALLFSQTARLGFQEVSVTTVDGGYVGGGDVLGTDVPDGSVLLLGDDGALRGSGRGARLAPAGGQALRGTSLLLPATLLVALLVLLLGGLPAVAGWPVLLPPAARAAGAALVLLLVACAPWHMREGPPAREAAACLGLPLLGAAGAVLLVPGGLADPDAATALAASWGAATAALLLWLVCRGAGRAVPAWSWTLLAVLVTGCYALSLPLRPVLLVVTALGAVGGLLVPGLAMSSPDNQVLDLEARRLVGRSVRERRPSKVARVTGVRAARTVREALVVSVELELVLAAMVVAGSLAVLRVAATEGVVAWGARAELVAVVALLLLRPRTARSRALRLLPRIAVAAVVVAAVLAVCLSGPDDVLVTTVSGASATMVAGALVLAGGGLLAAGVRLSLQPSAWWGRAGDIAQGLAALCALPAAVVAAGLIDTMRQI